MNQYGDTPSDIFNHNFGRAVRGKRPNAAIPVVGGKNNVLAAYIYPDAGTSKFI
ncbi:hypothetical protein AGMMS49957_02750 [Synergistales bacterium]|nr:hypothetical protein AGMMS49957_02750 [Synergistales bacterium]